ncbi:MAG: Gldg family protein [Verrucomicrobia bacterium]|nr:Gldg family protein [Verrucomicrobiota bacterium]
MKTEGAQMFWRTSGGLAGLGLLLVILVAANAIVAQLRLRTDLTEQKLYSLSEGTKETLKVLPELVTLKLFFSRTAPEMPVQLKAYASQVQDLLHEYRIAGGDMIALEVLDPKPDSETEEWAQSYGVTPQRRDMYGQPVYFGLVAVAGDQEGAIAVLDPNTDSLLEYNITRLIHRVTHPEKPAVGVLSSLPVLGDEKPAYSMQPTPGAKPWLAFQELQYDYDLRRLPPDVDAIPEDIQALIVVHPKEFSPATLYAIDQFVLRGGHLLAFVDPMNVADLENAGQSPFGRPQASSDLAPLFAAWGIGFDSGMVLADMKAVTSLRGAGNQAEENPLFLTLREANANRDDVLTAKLNMLMFPFAGTFNDQTQGELTVTPLVTSSDLSANISAMTAQFGTAAVNREFKPDAKTHALAIRVAGNFKTAYPTGKPSADPKAETDAETPSAPGLQEGKSTVILVADVDLIYDRFCVQELNIFGAVALQPLNDNINFFANMVEQIAGSSDLIGIRSRGEFYRPFVRVQALEEVARKQWHEKEQDLMAQLQDARTQLANLQAQKDEGQQFILSPQQKDAITRFRQTEIDIQRDLKDVRKNLRQEIEALGVKVKVANIVLMPLFVTIGGVAYGMRRRRRS